ncbi:hypothetical protein VFPPC_01980 [Pochonia chlamydosporia 170]|uniref:Uncharacterized protein n=1 Tax=Pochonia chlamydosporia 170 TaxID=1380566 RepID=A0A179F6H9_METCM|nr:hypothetical protein VFPPC_01980 [Pochonia chlamydosporia 170]OAQ60941.1 hypothetical protein VFPPC_01980 [Pochonia chlamydosporia 170]
MPQSSSNQKPTSPSATPISSDRAITEGLWMKGNIKLDHKESPFGENTSTSSLDGQSIPSAEQSATVACDIAGNDHVSIIHCTDYFPDDPDKAREFATSTGIPGIQVYPVSVFSHASDSQVINAVDASQNSDESRAKMETQISSGGAADAEIESQSTVRTGRLTAVSDANAVTDQMEFWDTTKDKPASSGFCNWKEGNVLGSAIEGTKSPSSDGVSRAKAEQQTGEQSKMRQGGVGSTKELEKVLTGSVPKTQNLGPGDTKTHAHSVNASNNPEVLGRGEIAQYFNSSNFPVEWGTEEGIDINSLLGDINEDKVNQPEDVLDRDHLSAAKTVLPSHTWHVDTDFLLEDGVTKMSEDDRRRLYIQGRREVKSSSAYTNLASVSGSDNRSRLLETEPKGGNGARQQPRMAGNTITVTTSIEQVITPNTGVVENSKLQAEIKAIPPSNAGNTHTVSCLTPMSTTSGDNRAASTQSKTQIGVAQLRPLPMNADGPDKMELPEPYPLFNADRDDLPQDNTNPTVRGSEALPGSCNIGQLSIHELDTSLSDLFDQTKDYGGTDANDCLPPISEFVSEHGTEETMAKNNTQPETGSSSSVTVKDSGFSTPPLSAVGAPVPKICTPSSAKTDVQVELAVEDNAEKWDSDADFSLDDGTREITNEDRITLGLYDGWPGKLSDVNTGLPPIEQTVRLFASDGPSEVDTGRMTAEHNPPVSIGPLRSIVANVSSLKDMELDQPCKLFDPPEPEPIPQEEAASDMIDASEHSSAQLSAISFHAANSGSGTHQVVDSAHLTGVSEMNDIASPMQDTTKDMPAGFGLRKWTGDDSVEQDIKYAKLVSSGSKRPESSFASRDVSIMPWTACYTDNADKAREIEASTGFPGIRVYPVDVFSRTTSNPQVSNEVDASQNSDNSRTEMETQVSPRRPSNE